MKKRLNFNRLNVLHIGKMVFSESAVVS